MSEEQEIVDPQEVLRDECRKDAHCTKYKDELQRCTDRVNSRKETAETCSQELFDFLHCVDHCVSKTLFKHLK